MANQIIEGPGRIVGRGVVGHVALKPEKASKHVWRRGRRSLLASLLALSVCTAGTVPGYAQQNVKAAPSNANVVYINCMPQEDTPQEEINWGQLLSLLGFAGVTSDKPDAQKWGAWFMKAGELQQQLDVARAGRSQVSVNQGQQQQVTYAPGPFCEWANPDDPSNFNVRRIFDATNLGVNLAANYVRDFNANGFWDFDEFVGIKTRFSSNEDIDFFLYNPKNKRLSKKEVKWELYYLPTGEKVAENSWDGNKYSGVSATYPPQDRKGRYGEYLSIFRSGDESVKIQLTITPPSAYSRGIPNGTAGPAGSRNILAFVSYPWIDFNKNGFVDFPDELPAYGKTTIDATERIIFGLSDPQGRGIQRKISGEIYDPRGAISLDGSFEARLETVIWVGQYNMNLTIELVQRGGYGTYRIMWFVDGVRAASATVTIAPARKE